MIKADGKLAIDEIVAAKTWFDVVGFSESDIKSDCLESSQALAVVSNLTYDEKRVVASILITIMIADGNIDDKEQVLINLITSLCNLPEMSAGDVKKTLEDLRDGKI